MGASQSQPSRTLSNSINAPSTNIDTQNPPTATTDSAQAPPPSPPLQSSQSSQSLQSAPSVATANNNQRRYMTRRLSSLLRREDSASKRGRPESTRSSSDMMKRRRVDGPQEAKTTTSTLVTDAAVNANEDNNNALGSSDPPPSPTSPSSIGTSEDPLLQDRLQSISSIREALGPDWPVRHGNSMERLMQRFRRPALSPQQPMGTNSTSTVGSPSQSSYTYSNTLSTIMGIGSPSSEPNSPVPSPTIDELSNSLDRATQGLNGAPEPHLTDDVEHDNHEPAVPVGAVLVIQGLAQTHATPEDGAENDSTDPPAPPDVHSLEHQARMIGNLLTVAAAATASTLLAPGSNVSPPNRSHAATAMQTIMDRLRPHRNRGHRSVEAALGDYLRSALRDSHTLSSQSHSGDEHTLSDAFERFLETLQTDLIRGIREFALPEQEEQVDNDEAEDSSANDSTGPQESSSEFTEGSTSIPTFHRQPGQMRSNDPNDLGIISGTNTSPRRLNFFRAHLFPALGSDGRSARAESEEAIVPSVFVGVRSVHHDPSLSTDELVAHPEFPFVNGQVPPTAPEASSNPAPVSSSTIVEPRRTLRERVLDRLSSRREQRVSGPVSTYLVYVIGGNYPRSHPLMAIPNLLTGGPLTDEDMQLVSELLGPAKPRTATQEDIEKSGLQIIKGAEMISIQEESKVLTSCADRCLICLSEYEPEEDCRILSCRHAFHKDCVDQWISTGRNNCPACRTEAVNKKPAAASSEITPTSP